MVAATAISFVPKPRYEATASLLVRLGREYVYRPEVGEGNAQPMAFDRDQALTSEVEIVTSRGIEEKVIADIGIARLYPNIAAARETPRLNHQGMALIELQSRLTALLVKDSNVIELSFKHPDPVLAAETVNRLIDAYIAKRRTILSEDRAAFARGQVETLHKQLNDLEAEIARFKRENNIVSFSEQRALLLEQRSQLDTQHKDASSRLGEVSSKLSVVKSDLGRVKPEVRLYSETTPDESVSAATKTLLDLRLQEQEAKSKYTPGSPVLGDIRRQLDQAERSLADVEARRAAVVRMGRNTVRDSVEIEALQLGGQRHAARAGQEIVGRQLKEVTGQLEALSAQETRLDSMLREKKLLEDAYQTYAKKLQDARIIEDLERQAKTNVSVIQAALPPVERKNLQPIILVIGFVFSLASAFAIAFVSELLRDTYLNPDELRASLGLPVLAVVNLATATPPERLGHGPRVLRA
jgi:uncharacterized protein involved in exopolysaccharide biosynthesis